VFSLDADERCTAAAAAEIRRIVGQADAADAYHVPRRNFLLGRWIRHSGWYPDYRQPQLFRRGKLRYTRTRYTRPTSSMARSDYHRAIAQVPFKDLAQIIHKMQRYSTLGVERLAERKTRPSMAKALAHGLGRSSVTTSCAWASSMAGPDSSSPSRTSEGTFYRYASTPSDAATDERAGTAAQPQAIVMLISSSSRPTTGPSAARSARRAGRTAGSRLRDCCR